MKIDFSGQFIILTWLWWEFKCNIFKWKIINFHK